MVRHPRYWTAEAEAILRATFADTPTSEIAARLGVKPTRVSSKAKLMGLKKSAEYLASERSGRMRKGDTRGSQTRFRAGQPSWNKGKEFRPGGRSSDRYFKKGMKPHNWVPVGTVVRATSGYLKEKVAEPNRWEWLHRRTWRLAHGSIPRGHVVAFRDGNIENCAIENLELFSQQEWMRRNSVTRLPEELRELVRAKAVLSREINKQAKGQ